MRLLVCGGAGFIGSNFVSHRVTDHHDSIVVLDKLTYAGRPENLHGLPNVTLIQGAIEDPDAVATAIGDGVDAIINFAAETHVDRSIHGPRTFVDTNVTGTLTLLEAARQHHTTMVHISTDEVYGSIDHGSFTETSPLAPSSPYSASKAAGDLLAISYHHTYDLPVIICRGSNNYGPRQYPEKLIPLMILNALHGDPLPVYGDGHNVRNWLYVADMATGISHALTHGTPGEIYNIGGPDEAPNIDIVHTILRHTHANPDLITHITDRPGHDRRYSLDSTKLNTIGWHAQTTLDHGLAHTVDWYTNNTTWWQPIRNGEYRTYYQQHYGRPLGGQG